jgi:hypothetical protein
LTACQCRKTLVKIFARKPPSAHYDTNGFFQTRQVLKRITSNEKEVGPSSLRHRAEFSFLAPD